MKQIKCSIYIFLGFFVCMSYAAHPGQSVVRQVVIVPATHLSITTERPSLDTLQVTRVAPQRNSLCSRQFLEYIHMPALMAVLSCAGASILFVNTENISAEQKALCLATGFFAEVGQLAWHTASYYFKWTR